MRVGRGKIACSPERRTMEERVSTSIKAKGFAAVAVWVVAAIVVARSSCVFGAQAGGVPVIINEVLASNDRHLADPQGQFDDWVELHNRGDAPGNWGGW